MFLGLLVCRVALGFFEAGQWPCALITTLRILSRENRSLGNSILQSGASLGAILTPQIVRWMVTDEVGSWRGPFQIIGLTGMVWIVPWLLIVRSRDLAATEERPSPELVSAEPPSGLLATRSHQFVYRYVALVVVVVSINATWHFFRAWLPLFLEKGRGYASADVQNFTTAYYLATDVGCLAAGIAVDRLTRRGWGVHRSRMSVFFVCLCLTGLSVLASQLPHGPLLLGLLVLVGAGSIGFFPNYYAFTQELSKRHQGKVTGSLGFITWMATGLMQGLVGERVQRTQSYDFGILWAGLAPIAAFAALLILWNLAGRDVREEQRNV